MGLYLRDLSELVNFPTRSGVWFRKPTYFSFMLCSSSPIIPERSEGLLFHQTLEFHLVLTTTESTPQRRQNGALLRPLPSKSAFGELFSHARFHQIRCYASQNRVWKRLGLCYLAVLKPQTSILSNWTTNPNCVRACPRVKSSNRLAASRDTSRTGLASPLRGQKISKSVHRAIFELWFSEINQNES